jgi:hypothetical protein
MLRGFRSGTEIPCTTHVSCIYTLICFLFICLVFLLLLAFYMDGATVLQAIPPITKVVFFFFASTYRSWLWASSYRMLTRAFLEIRSSWVWAVMILPNCVPWMYTQQTDCECVTLYSLKGLIVCSSECWWCHYPSLTILFWSHRILTGYESGSRYSEVHLHNYDTPASQHILSV